MASARKHWFSFIISRMPKYLSWIPCKLDPLTTLEYNQKRPNWEFSLICFFNFGNIGTLPPLNDKFGWYLSSCHVHVLLELAAVAIYSLCYNQAIVSQRVQSVTELYCISHTVNIHAYQFVKRCRLRLQSSQSLNTKHHTTQLNHKCIYILASISKQNTFCLVISVL